MDVEHSSATAQVFEHDGLLWRAKPGATSSFDEFVQAKEQLLVLWREADWDPWRKEDIAALEAEAHQTWAEWDRAEPDFKPMTEKQVTAYMASLRRESRAEQRAEDSRWARDRERYDLELEKARYALLEREALYVSLQRRVAEYRDDARYPYLSADRRAKEISELESRIDANAEQLERLRTLVGTPENVVDADGKLPSDRRKINLISYRMHRIDRVEELRAAVAALQEQFAAANDRNSKGRVRSDLSLKEQRLNALLAVPRQEAEQMCADCYTPQYQHLSGSGIEESRPCPRWPMYAARMKQFEENLRRTVEQLNLAPPEPPESATPKPLATLPGNLPIGEVIEKLTVLQAQYPDAVIKRGRANRWELWPSDR